MDEFEGAARVALAIAGLGIIVFATLFLDEKYGKKDEIDEFIQSFQEKYPQTLTSVVKMKD